MSDLHIHRLCLNRDVVKRLERVVLEHQQKDVLLAQGLRPVRKLIFRCCPGCGADLAVRALGKDLGLNVIEVHDFIVDGKDAIYLVTEGLPMDNEKRESLADIASCVGAGSLFIYITSRDVPQRISDRFDASLFFPLPRKDETKAYMRQHLASLDTEGIDWDEFFDITHGRNYEDLRKVCDYVKRSAILRSAPRVSFEDLVEALDFYEA